MSRKKGTLWLLQFFSKFLLSVIPSLCFSQHYIDPNNLPQPTSAALALGRKELQNLYPNLLALGILESLLITNSGLHARSKISSSFPNVWNFYASQLLFEELRKVSKFTDFWNPHKSQFNFVSSFHLAGLISGLSSSSIKAHSCCPRCLWRGAISPRQWQCSAMWCYLCSALYYLVSQFHDVTVPIFLTITAGSLPGFHLLHRLTPSGCIFGMDLLY